MPSREDPRKKIVPEGPKVRPGEVGTERSRPPEKRPGDPAKCPLCNSRTFTHRAGATTMDEKGWHKTVQSVCSNGHVARTSREPVGGSAPSGDGRPFDGAW